MALFSLNKQSKLSLNLNNNQPVRNLHFVFTVLEDKVHNMVLYKYDLQRHGRSPFSPSTHANISTIVLLYTHSTVALTM